MDKFLCIIQARSGSTRMPSKILLPFYENKSILQIVMEKLRLLPNTEILVATTTNPHDNEVEAMVASSNTKIFRGSECDVLQRFVDASNKFNAKKIIRICSDNPFLDINSLVELMDKAKKNKNAEYISFNINGMPSIKTHYGFWAEYVTKGALEKVLHYTDENIYHEHVTNYIYTHPEKFVIDWIDGPNKLLKDKNIRLTIDTVSDFKNAQMIYAELYESGIPMTINNVVECVLDHSELILSMNQEIKNNTK